jgi:hypothetical protein
MGMGHKGVQDLADARHDSVGGGLEQIDVSIGRRATHSGSFTSNLVADRKGP